MHFWLSFTPLRKPTVTYAVLIVIINATSKRKLAAQGYAFEMK